MDADEAEKFVTIILSDGRQDVVDYGRIGTGCVESRYLRLVNPSSDAVAFLLTRDPQSHPLGDVFKVCPSYGEILPGGSFKVTVKYRPRFPHVKDIDYFSIMFNSTKSMQLQLEGVSLAPALTVSRNVLDFGLPTPRSESSRCFLLTNEGTVPAAFSFPLSSAQFAVSPTGGQVAAGRRQRVTVSCWTDRRRPTRRLLPLLVHNGASHVLQLLAGAGSWDQPPTDQSQRFVVLDVDRVDFNDVSVVDGDVQVVHLTNVAKQEVRIEWLADRRDVFTVQPATACVRPGATAMFEVLFLPDVPDQVYCGHVEALLVLPSDADDCRPAEASLTLLTFGHTFSVGAETWVPRVQLTPSPVVMAPCPVSGLVSSTCTLRNLDTTKPLVYDLSSAPDSLTIRPSAGCVPAGELHVLDVQHSASAIETSRKKRDLSWRLNVHPNHSLKLALLLSQESPAVAWSPPQLLMPHACPGMLVQRVVEVRNLTRCRLLLAAEPSDQTLHTDCRLATLAPNERRRVVWTCRVELCGLHEFVVPHRLRLLDPCDRPLGPESVQILRVAVRVVAEAVSCRPRRVELGAHAVGAVVSGRVTLTNDCTSDVSLLAALLPRPLETTSSGAAAILTDGDEGRWPDEGAVRRLTVAASSDTSLTLCVRPDRAGPYAYDLTYQLLPEPASSCHGTAPRALAEVTLTAHHPHVRIADLEAVCSDRFEDKLKLWQLLAVDRVNRALADETPASPLCLVFPPRPVGAPPLTLVLLLENPCLVSARWRWEPARVSEDSGANDADWFALSPTEGTLQPAACQTLSLTVGPFAESGIVCARLLFSVDGGQTLPLTAVATAVATGCGWLYTISEPPCPGLLLPSTPPERPHALHSALERGRPQRLALHPVSIGCRVPPLQFCPLFNGGLQPVTFHVHTDSLDALQEDNYGVPVLRCLDTEGTVPAGGCTRIRLVFRPLEQKEYSALVPICVSAPCCHQPLLVTGRGTADGDKSSSGHWPLLPTRQRAVMPRQQVLLSHRFVHFGTLSIHTERSQLVYLHNVSDDVFRFAWTRRLAVADCCATYGAADSAAGDRDTTGLTVQPEPAGGRDTTGLTVQPEPAGGRDITGPTVQPEPADGVLRPGEVLPVRLTLSAGELTQVYSHTIHLAFRNLSREYLFELNHAAWETECRRRQAEFVITEAHPNGTCRPPSPPPAEPAAVYTTISLAALISHVDDTPLSSEPSWRERTFVPLMTTPGPRPVVPAAAAAAAAAPAAASAADVACVRRVLTAVLWQLLRDCELHSSLKRLRKDAVPVFQQLVAEPSGQERRFRRPREAEKPLLLERSLHSVLFNLVREAARGEMELGEGLVTRLPVAKEKVQSHQADATANGPTATSKL